VAVAGARACTGAVPLRPPVDVMLARPVWTLPGPDALPGGCAYEPKWDGFRCLAFRSDDGAAVLQSRSRRLLTGFFPEIAGAAACLPPAVVLDGELVVWRHGRVDFAALQRRIHPSAKRARELAAQTPASYVAFDVLQHQASDVRRLPYRDRRRLLTGLLGDTGPPWVLCPSTPRVAEAADWFDDYRVAGVEGLVVKGQGQPYRGRVRGWLKLRHRVVATAIVGGVLGPLDAPEALILGRLDRAGLLRVAGATGPLTGAARTALAAAFRPADERHPWRPMVPAAWLGAFPSGRDEVAYTRVLPTVVVEVAADTAWEHGRWRHRPLLLRARADLAPGDVPRDGDV